VRRAGDEAELTSWELGDAVGCATLTAARPRDTETTAIARVHYYLYMSASLLAVLVLGTPALIALVR
jgi:hypothetical protein